MKYLNILLVFMMIQLSLTFLNATGLVPFINTEVNNVTYDSYKINPQEQIDFATLDDDDRIKNCEQNDQEQSFTCKILKFSNDKFYARKGIDTSDFVSTSAFGDFITGLFIMAEVFFQGLVYIYPTFKIFLPTSLHSYIYFFVVPIYFVYLIAILQLIANRNTGDLQ